MRIALFFAASLLSSIASAAAISDLNCMAANGLKFQYQAVPEQKLPVIVSFGFAQREFWLAQTKLDVNNEGVSTIHLNSLDGIKTATIESYQITFEVAEDQFASGEVEATGTVNKTIISLFTGIPITSPTIPISCKLKLAH